MKAKMNAIATSLGAGFSTGQAQTQRGVQVPGSQRDRAVTSTQIADRDTAGSQV